jgi:hypothetical protein
VVKRSLQWAGGCRHLIIMIKSGSTSCSLSCQFTGPGKHCYYCCCLWPREQMLNAV